MGRIKFAPRYAMATTDEFFVFLGKRYYQFSNKRISFYLCRLLLIREKGRVIILSLVCKTRRIQREGNDIKKRAL